MHVWMSRLFTIAVAFVVMGAAVGVFILAIELLERAGYISWRVENDGLLDGAISALFIGVVGVIASIVLNSIAAARTRRESRD